MKWIYLLTITVAGLICNSCSKEEQSSIFLLSESAINTRASNIGGTIAGEKNTYVGDGVYTYKLNFSSQSNSVGIKISASGGGAMFKNPNTNRYDTYLTCNILKGVTQYSFDVLWTKEASGAALMVRPEFNSTIQLNADLRDINVLMKPMTINAPTTFELGSTLMLWCNYPLNKDTNFEWIYDKSLFSEVSQSASVAQSKFQINLKSLQPFRGSLVNVEVYDFFTNSIGAREYFLVRKASKNLSNVGPQISGNNSLSQYGIYTYQFDTPSYLFNIQWEDNGYIRCIGDKKQSLIKLNPIKAGKSEVRVSYNYKNSTERYCNSLSVNIEAAFPEIVGGQNICYNNNGSYSIRNLPSQANVQWRTTGGTNPQTYTGEVFICKNISPSISSSDLYATITLLSGFAFEKKSYLRLFNPTAPFGKGTICSSSINAINGQADVSLYDFPNWATNFVWSSINVSSICTQGQAWTCISFNPFEVWDTEVEIKVSYQSPCGDWYEVSAMIPISH